MVPVELLANFPSYPNFQKINREHYGLIPYSITETETVFDSVIKRRHWGQNVNNTQSKYHFFGHNLSLFRKNNIKMTRLHTRRQCSHIRRDAENRERDGYFFSSIIGFFSFFHDARYRSFVVDTAVCARMCDDISMHISVLRRQSFSHS